MLDRWKGMLDDVEDRLTEPEVDEAKVEDAQKRIDEAKEAREKRQKEKEAEAAAAAKSTDSADIDPYDKTIWAEAGIDPIRISLNGQYVYTLRCYVGDKPRFLGRHGEINTFPNSRALVRWLIDAHDHDLEELDTWGDLVSAANAGELEVTVHDSNQYSFAGLHDDISESIDAVDTDQLGRAYELLADAADWAGDDGVNKILLSYPKLQNYLAYMLGSPVRLAALCPLRRGGQGLEGPGGRPDQALYALLEIRWLARPAPGHLRLAVVFEKRKYTKRDGRQRKGDCKINADFCIPLEHLLENQAFFPQSNALFPLHGLQCSLDLHDRPDRPA